MWRLVKYLEENDPESLLKNRSELVQKLQEIWPDIAISNKEEKKSENSGTNDDASIAAGDGDDSNDTVAFFTRDREELARTITSALWLGLRAQQIKDSHNGDKSIEQFFRDAMLVAFETGRRLAMTPPHSSSP